jgi:CxxC motif-containing protein
MKKSVKTKEVSTKKFIRDFINILKTKKVSIEAQEKVQDYNIQNHFNGL